MYLEMWMIAVLAMAFGACAWWSTATGFLAGKKAILTALYHDKIISLKDSKIIPYNGERR